MYRPALAACLLFLVCLGAAPGWAVIETYEFSSSELEARYHRLSQELRCPKCQNQNIADSNAPISEDLRKLLYNKLEAGASDEEILDDLVARYGEFVRYRPAKTGAALALWLAPWVLLGGGLLALLFIVRRGSARSAGPAPEITAAERERLAKMLPEEREQT